jgi:CheY-like chemotaxis protein
MPTVQFPFAVRLIGFSDEETENFEAAFVAGEGNGCGYVILAADNLQDPDLNIANGSQLKALVRLADLRPSEVRPALLVGKPQIELPYPCVERPMRPETLLKALGALIEKRADALSRLEASDVVRVPERRRRDRVDLDLTDPAEYERMRARVAGNGAILVVDKNRAFCDFLAGLLARHNIPVGFAGDEATAIEACRQQPVSVVLINTSTPEVDPYRLCWGVKERESLTKTTVIFLVGKQFAYDSVHARNVGVEGFLSKPVSSHHLLSVLKKFLQFSR